MRHPLRCRPADGDDADGGFLLLEAVIAIALISIIMAGMAVFFVRSMASAATQRERDVAVQVANTELDRLRTMDPTDLWVGRDQTSVSAQFAAVAASDPAYGYLTDMQQAYDANAATGTGSTAFVPTSASTTTLNGRTYTYSDYLGWCWNRTDATGYASCTRTSGGSALKYLRVAVVVTWSGVGCTPATCTYISTTLFDTDGDPQFKIGAAAPSNPTAASPGNKSYELGETVSVTLTESGGIPTYTWTATGLPDGLAVNPDGIISGTPTATGSFAAQATVTDGFGHTSTTSFTWTIVPAVTTSATTSKTWTKGAASTLTLSASNGVTPYSWTITSGALPSGLSLGTTTGAITGTPTAATTPANGTAVYKVTDAHGMTSSGTLTWQVLAAPTVTALPATTITQGGTESAARNLTATYTCANAPCTVSLGSMPAGSWTLSPSVVNTAGSGAVIVTGTVSGTATVGTIKPTLTISDAGGASASSTSGTWTVVGPPTVVGLSSVQFMPGAAGSSQAQNSNGSQAGTWSATGLPAWLTLSAAGALSTTTVAPTGYQKYTFSLTFTTADGIASPALSQTVYVDDLTLNIPTGVPWSSVNKNIGGNYVSGGSTKQSITFSTNAILPPGMTMGSNGMISGTTTYTGSFTASITVTDGLGTPVTQNPVWTF